LLPDISIVITSYNSKEFLIKCIESIVKSIRKHSYEIIVVDDRSSDGSAQTVRERFPNTMIIQNKLNLGYVKSNNIGMRAAKGDKVLSLNNDTVILADAIDKLADFMDKKPDAGAVGPKLLNADGSIQLQCRRRFPTPLNSLFYFTGLSRLFPKNRMFGAYLMTYIDDMETIKVDALCGAAMMVRREVIDQVGLMDVSYIMYGDDIDWCYRMKQALKSNSSGQAGWKVYYLPEAEMIHYGGRGGSRKQSYRNIFEFHRAMAIFHSKHYAKRYFFLLNWLVYSGIWFKCGLSLVKNLFRKEKYVGTRKP